MREWDTIEKHNDGKYYYHSRSCLFNVVSNENWNKVDESNLTIRFSYDPKNLMNEGSASPNIISNRFTSRTGSHGDYEYCMTGNGSIFVNIFKSKLDTPDIIGFNKWLQHNNTQFLYKSTQEKVYECTSIDLITYENETNYMIECGAISPKTTLKCQNYIGNVINTLKDKVSYLEDKLYKTNLANFTVALNTLDTKLRLEQLEKTPI